MKTNVNQITTTSTILRASVITVSLIGSMLVAGPAAAASACKGLDDTACNSNTSCGWVQGYQRKDGRTVKSFCRTKSVKKSLAKKSGSNDSGSPVSSK